jgi:serine/threonine protein kinase HipA of HipAB toxin-antitoxin module
MHFGNISFYLTFEGPFILAPIYDMLPMMYAPTVANAIPSREFEPPLPNADSLDIWRDMTNIAKGFWESVGRHELISRGFKVIANRNAEIVGQASRLR